MLEQVEHAEHIVVVSPFPDSIIWKLLVKP
jgi:hypothetical protein